LIFLIFVNIVWGSFWRFFDESRLTYTVAFKDFRLPSTRISKGSEDPVQVFNKYGSLDGLDEMDVEVVQSSTPFKG